MFIDKSSVRGGDAEYIFDYDGNIISKKFGGWFSESMEKIIIMKTEQRK